ncbi:MAG: single-stranded DNA-binding protein [Candidatus Ozemobacteraceae bacterium]
MLGLASVVLAGNITKDPELRQTSKGKAWLNLTVAVNRSRKSPEGEWKKEADFYSVIAWETVAENCAKFLKKGRPILVEGRLQNRSYIAKDGTSRIVTEIQAGTVRFLGGAYHEGENSHNPSSDESPIQAGMDGVSDSECESNHSDGIPF